MYISDISVRLHSNIDFWHIYRSVPCLTSPFNTLWLQKY